MSASGNPTTTAPAAMMGPIAPSARPSPPASTTIVSTTATASLISAAVGDQQGANTEVRSGHATRAAMLLTDQYGDSLSSFQGPLFSKTNSNDGPSASLSEAEQAKELTPEGLAALPMMPWSPESSIVGSVPADRSWTTFTVPVGPNTTTLQLTIHPGVAPDGSVTTRLDQMYLAKPDGTVLAAITGVATLSANSDSSDLTLNLDIHSAPTGGLLVLRLIDPSSQPSVAPGNSNGPSYSINSGLLGGLPPSLSLPPNTFEVDVQRHDAPATTSEGGTGAQTPIFTSSSPVPSLIDTTLNHIGRNSTAVAPSIEQVSYAPAFTASSLPGNSVLSRNANKSPDVDSMSTAISLGPLVSRGSAPLGPALATSIDDPAPPIDRDAHDDGPPAPGLLVGEDRDLSLKLRMAHDGGRTTAHGLDPQDGEAADDDRDLFPTTSLKGLGGMPFLVASFHRGHRPAEAEELAATLRQPADDAAPAVVSLDRPDRKSEIAQAGIATRAAGFIVALGLASGPLYPDLIALAKQRLRRRRPGGSGNRRFRSH